MSSTQNTLGDYERNEPDTITTLAELTELQEYKADAYTETINDTDTYKISIKAHYNGDEFELQWRGKGTFKNQTVENDTLATTEHEYDIQDELLGDLDNPNELLEEIANLTDWRTTIDGSPIGTAFIDQETGEIVKFTRPAAYVEKPDLQMKEDELQELLDLNDDQFFAYPHYPNE